MNVLVIPFIEFQLRVGLAAPGIKQQDVPTAAYVHVFNRQWFRETFWPYWDAEKAALDAQLQNKPETNNLKRGTCDEITKRFISCLIICARQLHGDEDVGVAALETSIDLGNAQLNYVPGPGRHRTVTIALTDDESEYIIEAAEPQLTYANYQTTPVENAVALGVRYLECWV
jgi:hypothetical protein